MARTKTSPTPATERGVRAEVSARHTWLNAADAGKVLTLRSSLHNLLRRRYYVLD